MLTAAAIVLAALAGFALAWRMLTVTVPPQRHRDVPPHDVSKIP